MDGLVGLDRDGLQRILGSYPNAALRAKQIARHIYLHASPSFDDMLDLPKDLRGALAERLTINPLEIVSRRSSRDGVQKLLVRSPGSGVVECVLLPYKSRTSCCLSSQIGCPMACKFCATGMGGFDRNLETDEIVGQYLHLQRLSNSRIGHVVFMGMGEPLLNLDRVLASLRLLHNEIGISYRRITVSTVGIVPKIRELAAQNLQIHLAFSLHSPFDSIRDRLMPVNRRWPVMEVMDAMIEYQRATGRKITIEYLLINELTDTIDQADALATMLKSVPSVINLIPFNWVDTEQGFMRPSAERIRRFRAALERRGVNVTQRVERGHDIAAACGQLAGSFANKPITIGEGKEALKYALG